MSTSRVSTIVIVAAAVAVAAVTMSLTGSKALRPQDDFALRHPQGLPAAQPAGYFAGEDAAQGRANAASVDTSDYFLRHPESQINASASELSDFFQRHPDWTFTASAIDSSDYFLRHPELIVPETDDYALRHPELSQN